MPTIEDAIARDAASIDEMLAGPFAGWDWALGTSDHFTGRTLHASPELWQVDAGVAAAWRATIDSHLRALVAELAGPWGAPDVVDLSVVLQRGLEGNDVPPPVDHLSDVTGVLFLWREPGVDRWWGWLPRRRTGNFPSSSSRSWGTTSRGWLIRSRARQRLGRPRVSKEALTGARLPRLVRCDAARWTLLSRPKNRWRFQNDGRVVNDTPRIGTVHMQP